MDQQQTPLPSETMDQQQTPPPSETMDQQQTQPPSETMDQQQTQLPSETTLASSENENASETALTSTEREKTSSPEPILTIVVELSDKSRLTVHPGDKWKSGYVTLSRVSKNKNGWRNVHISKKSFEKLAENFSNLEEALKERSTRYQLMLTRKQHVLTTKFQREGKEPIYYVSFIHPTEEKDILDRGEEVNHAKTINLTEHEFEGLKNNLERSLKVVRSKNVSHENEESLMLDGYRWSFRRTGERSQMIFLTQTACVHDARQHYERVIKERPGDEDMECEIDSLYDCMPVQVRRPSKLELIEHIAYILLIKTLENDGVCVDDNPPDGPELRRARHFFDYSALTAITKRLLLRLKYKQIYLTSELVQLFLYVNGMERVENTLCKHETPGRGRLYPRLLNHCFCSIYEELCKD